MPETRFTISVDDQLKQAFESAATAACANGADLIRQFMQAYVEQLPAPEEYDRWFLQQVEHAMAEIEAGEFVSNEEVEAEFTQRRSETRRKINA